MQNTLTIHQEELLNLSEPTFIFRIGNNVTIHITHNSIEKLWVVGQEVRIGQQGNLFQSRTVNGVIIDIDNAYVTVIPTKYVKPYLLGNNVQHIKICLTEFARLNYHLCNAKSFPKIISGFNPNEKYYDELFASHIIQYCSERSIKCSLSNNQLIKLCRNTKIKYDTSEAIRFIELYETVI